MPLPRRQHKQPRYNTISSSDDDAAAEDEESQLASNIINNGEEETITVTILDFCHTRFPVTLTAATSTVLDLKRCGAAIHNVPESQQRLIYQGKLLADDAQLKDVGIVENDAIVHLFPKPRVVVVNNNNCSSSDSNNDNEDESHEREPHSAARVPTIILDQEEAERRGQILVLGSLEYHEALNNIKLFSFMLLIISTIELLNLTGIALGQGGLDGGSQQQSGFVPLQEDDDFFHDDDNSFSNNTAGGNATLSPSSSVTGEDPALAVYQTWTPLSWIDLVVSVLGIYVSLLGIKASNENQLNIAKQYLMGTCLVAFLWLVYNYLMTVAVDKAVEAEMEDNTDIHTYDADMDESVYDQALQVMVLPAMVWLLCIFRAWQFQRLLAEAEQEAANRIAGEHNHDSGHGNDDGGTGVSAIGAPHLSNTELS
jgi:Ubiquitin family